MVKKYVCIPTSFLVINVCNKEKTLCSPCILHYVRVDSLLLKYLLNYVTHASIYMMHYL
jgi:hypothetical protein